MILFHALYIIWVFLFLPLLNAEEFIPKVTETLSEYTFNLVSFDDSNTLIRLDNMAVWISFDSGENWKTVKDIEERIFRLVIDPLHGRTGLLLRYMDHPNFTSQMMVESHGGL